MNFAGMVFELMLSGFWWLVALTAVWCAFATHFDLCLNRLTSVAAHVGDLGMAGAVALFTVAYALGQVGRRFARWVYRDYRQWVVARAFLRWSKGQEKKVEAILRDCTSGGWNRSLTILRLRLRTWETSAGLHGTLGEEESEAVPLFWTTGSPARQALGAIAGYLSFPPAAVTTGPVREALDECRYALDVLRDYVIAADAEDADYDLMYHWRCLDAAQNATLPLGIAAAALLVTIQNAYGVPHAITYVASPVAMLGILAVLHLSLVARYPTAHQIRHTKWPVWSASGLLILLYGGIWFISMQPWVAAVATVGMFSAGVVAVRALNISFSRHSYYHACAILRSAILIHSTAVRRGPG